MFPLLLDGKQVRCWLFAALIKSVDGTRHPQLVQVQAFSVDHALKRLEAVFPMIPKREWNMLEELDLEHDVGALGMKLPLLPTAISGVQRVH